MRFILKYGGLSRSRGVSNRAQWWRHHLRSLSALWCAEHLGGVLCGYLGTGRDGKRRLDQESIAPRGLLSGTETSGDPGPAKGYLTVVAMAHCSGWRVWRPLRRHLALARNGSPSTSRRRGNGGGLDVREGQWCPIGSPLTGGQTYGDVNPARAVVTHAGTIGGCKLSTRRTTPGTPG